MRRWTAGLALVTLGLLASPSAVPVYDGVGAPDEPYRSVGASPAPSDARAEVGVTAGAALAVQARTVESGPQALLDLGPGAFTAASPFTLTVTALAPDGTPPRGELDGNVYRVAVTGDAVLQPEKAQGFLFLRAKVMTTPDPVVVFRASPTDAWVEQQTTRSGRDNLGTPFRKLGDYAVVRLPGSTPLEASGGLTTGRVVLLVGGVLLLLVITVLVLRRPRVDED